MNRLLCVAGPALVLGAIGAAGWLLQLPLLLPSLAPSVVLQATSPEQKSARAVAVGAGHCVGLLAGLVAVFVVGASEAPSVMSSGVIEPVRIGAAMLAVALSLAAQQALGLSHPPAEATTLLVALGGLKPGLREVLAFLAGLLLLVVLGEVLRRMQRPAGGDRAQAGAGTVGVFHGHDGVRASARELHACRDVAAAERVSQDSTPDGNGSK